MQDLNKIFLCASCQDNLFWKKELDTCPICKDNKLKDLKFCLDCLAVCARLKNPQIVDLNNNTNQCFACKNSIL